ncbi:MAG TPA: potassium ABC transporter ATPase [Bacteroidota bacterium]|nr:potassium ABC transporter ATPase [Bacteroidota bacterium]
MDALYIGITVVFFLLSWGLMKGCEVLGKDKRGEKS